ncbi:MAG: bifunctional phosphoribosylaminoimidazolecarboxamide formyltransferase/IMP cyclohydrolase [Bacteroidota bacterium]
MGTKRITSALISVFHKDNLEPIIRRLHELNVQLYSTGGTQKFIDDLGVPVTAVEDVTDYPSIFGGRVKTLHPKVFGGILHRRDNESDLKEAGTFEIPPIDLVIVDLYPFEETVASGADHEAIIEKIDIGGISLIRAAAKNFKDVVIVPSMDSYSELLGLLEAQNGETNLAQRQLLAAKAFDISSHYDAAIFNYMNPGTISSLKLSKQTSKALRYGENPHQKSEFFGHLDEFFDQLHGKEISYNNLVDIEAAVQLIAEFEETTFAILKHNNACGIASGSSVKEAYVRAFAADTISAFGGILVTNRPIDLAAAEEMHSLFFEVLIAPSFDEDALPVLMQKKNRILLVQKQDWVPSSQIRTMLNGLIRQDHDSHTDRAEDLKVVTKETPSEETIKDLLFASKVCKHTKSNAIVLVQGGQMLASGVGQTSRVDALEQAIAKAKKFGFSLKGAVMASDAFFPFPDCVEIADQAGIRSVIQPGGSIKDQLSVDYCDQHHLSMVMTGFRHFKH